jgi:hypothetical protein
MPLARARRMKLGLNPLLLGLVVSALLTVKTAQASPWHASRSSAQEDALADGDIDPDDIATQSPLSTLFGATNGRPVLGGPSSSTWISLLGFTRRTLEDRQEIGGVLLVGLPLDRFARANTRLTRAAPSTFGVMPELLPASAQETASLQRVSSAEQPFELVLTPRLARACVAAAWRTAGIGADDTRLDAIVSRARWSAVLPEARLRAVRFEDARLSLDTSTDTSRLRDSAGANVGFEARLTWRFDRLIYADDEPSFERIRLEQRDARARIAAKVLEALFHWQRAALDLRTLPPSQQGTRDEADVRLRLMEAEAALDVLTNGWFATQNARMSRSASSSSARNRSEGGYATPIPVGRGSAGDL